MNKNKERKTKDKKRNIFSTTEESRRIFIGLPGGDPNEGTKWSDTLIMILFIILIVFIYILLT